MKHHKQVNNKILMPVLVGEIVKNAAVFKEKKSSAYFNNHEVFIDGLKQIYWSKRVLIKLLDQMIRLSYSENLADILEEYQVVTHRQSRRLEDIFSTFCIKPVAKVCQPLKNIIHETSDDVYQMPKSKRRDIEFISLILQFQKYWIAKGEMLCEISEAITEYDVKLLLQENQKECELLDMNLAYLLEKNITNNKF